MEKVRYLLCLSGLHRYGPDEEAGYPYQRCRNCGAMSIYRPPRLPAVQKYL